MSNQKSIVVLLSFFGKFPWYFNLFIQSCKNNLTINFCIISDNNKTPAEVPPNVTFKFITPIQFQSLASTKLGFDTSKIEGYKICDFRPAFGVIFPELISQFEFWGYGDIDIMYGDLRNFLTPTILKKHDILSFRPEYLTGSFTICRNSDKINTLFKESKDYRTVLSKDKYFNFDECNFLFAQLQARQPIQHLTSEIESMTHIVRRMEREGSLNAYFDFNLLEGPVGNIKWEKGKVIYKNQFEAILYHLLKFKDIYKPQKEFVLDSNYQTIHFSKKSVYIRKRK